MGFNCEFLTAIQEQLCAISRNGIAMENPNINTFQVILLTLTLFEPLWCTCKESMIIIIGSIGSHCLSWLGGGGRGYYSILSGLSLSQ